MLRRNREKREARPRRDSGMKESEPQPRAEGPRGRKAEARPLPKVRPEAVRPRREPEMKEGQLPPPGRRPESPRP